MELKISAGQTVRIIVDDAPDPDAIAFGIAGAPAGDPPAAAFAAGYDAGWNDSAEGHNGEYTRESFTDEKYAAQAKAALDAYLAGSK